MSKWIGITICRGGNDVFNGWLRYSTRMSGYGKIWNADVACAVNVSRG